jgi:hypothetical protein
VALIKKQKLILPTIGWREWISFPELGIEKIKAKVDTGAKTSALYAYDLEFFKRNKKEFVRFKVHPLQRNSKESITTEAQVIEMRMIKDSGGKTHRRPVIMTVIEMGGISWPIELTLASRDSMGFRLLLGREAIRKRFLIDPSRSNLAKKIIK